MDHTPRVHEGETVVREGKRFGIAVGEADRKTFPLEAVARDEETDVAQIDADAPGPGAGEPDMVRACTDTDFEDSLSPRLIEPGKISDKRLSLSTLPLELGIVRLAGSDRSLAGAAGRRIPESPDVVFEIPPYHRRFPSISGS